MFRSCVPLKKVDSIPKVVFTACVASRYLLHLMLSSTASHGFTGKETEFAISTVTAHVSSLSLLSHCSGFHYNLKMMSTCFAVSDGVDKNEKVHIINSLD